MSRLPLRWQRRLVRAKRVPLLIHGAAARLSASRGPAVIERTEGADDLGAALRVAVFAHHDPDGRLRRYVRYHLDALRQAGFAVVFATNGPALGAGDRAWLAERAALVLRRRNVGWDFGAYRDAIAAVGDVGRLDALLIVNDSVYGPLHDLASAVRRMDPRTADVWGITDNREHAPHVQSYFVLFHRAALASPAFGRFWARVRDVRSKYWTIRRYEIGLTRALQGAGLRTRVLWPSDAAADAFVARPHDHPVLRDVAALASEGDPFGPQQFFWRELLETGCLYLKRDLVRSNPGRVPGTDAWRDVLGRETAYDTALIDDDLRAGR